MSEYNTMNYKSILLFLCSVTVLAILYNIPTYNSWMERKIFTISNIGEQTEHMDIEERRESRYGYSYMVFKDMAKKMKQEGDATVLIPPNAYMTANKVEMRMVEPALYYYFTGMNAVNVNSPKVWMANWALVAENGHMSLLKFTGRKQADSMINLLKKYPQP